MLIKKGEAYLVNAHINPYEKAAYSASEPTRDRKLLLSRKEIDYLVGRLAGSYLTLVPTKLYFKRNYAKIEIALASGKKKYDKREVIKRKEAQREARKLLRSDKLKYQEERAR